MGPYGQLRTPTEKLGARADIGLYINGPLQIKGPYRQGAPPDKWLFQTIFRAPMDKQGPLQTRGPYRQKAPIDQGPLQIKDPYMIYIQGREGLLQTSAPVSKGSYMIYRQMAPYSYAGSL